MKNVFLDSLWCLALALVIAAIVTIIASLYSFVGIFLSKIHGAECSHRYQKITDNENSPIKCLDCGKIVE